MLSAKRFRRNRGFILSELLIVMIAMVFLMPITVIQLQIVSGSLSFDESIQDEIAFAQLRRILMQGMDYEADGNSISFSYQGGRNQLVFMNQHVLLKPGTQIFLSDLDQASFFESDSMLYITYNRKSKTVTRALVHE